MTDANIQSLVPTAPPVQPPSGPAKNPYDQSITAILYELFATVASIYKVVTQKVLATLNDALNELANQENTVAQQISNLEANMPKKGDKNYNKVQAELNTLKNEQSQVQLQIQQTQAAQTSATSGAATFATILNKIIESLKTAQAAVIQNQ